jgi:hypothetical protein
MHEDRTRLEDRDAGVMIDDRRNFAVRTNLDEVRLELVAVPNVYRMNRVLEPALLEHDRGFAAVGRRPGVEIDHLFSPATIRGVRVDPEAPEPIAIRVWQ